jgi:hypothetical protein
MNQLALLAHHYPFLVACIGGALLAFFAYGFYRWLDWMEALA